MTTNIKTFDFQTNKTEILNLETLQLTHKENDVYGQPLKGIYHYEVINRITQLCEKSGLNWELEEVFAAQNQSRQMPGVVVLPQVEAIHGANAVEAHILRRIYATIRIHDGQTYELTTTIAIAYHQDGIQIGFGPYVKICHNQCILAPDRIVSNYGNDKVSNVEVFQSVENWLTNFFHYQETDMRIIEKMKEIICHKNDVFQIIGLLTSLRVAHDSKELTSELKTYPLTQAQISQFTENYLIKAQETPIMSLWDIYNIATELYKPDKAEIPNLLPQNLSMIEVLKERYNL